MDNVTYSLFAVLLLLVANGFFVAAEFALVKARGFRIETLANEGNKAAKLTVKIQQNLEAYLAACQLGITMASLGLGWVGEPAVASLLEPLFLYLGVPESILHTTAFIVGFLIFSSLHIVVGEQVPKTLAIRKAEPVSLWVAYPLHYSYLLVYPLNWLLNNATRAILKFFRVAEATHADVYTNAEIIGLVETSEEHGELAATNALMLKNLLEFDQQHVGRIMIPKTALNLLDLNNTPEQNLSVIRKSGHSRFPLIDTQSEEEIVGVILVQDLYTALLDGIATPWADLKEYSREPTVVPETQKISRLFDSMRTERNHMSLVVDEYGKLIGIVTLEDLLEEIVGEIEDETDKPGRFGELTEEGVGVWHADGLMSLSDLERLTGFEVPDDLDANTLSGLILTVLEELPEVGEIIEKYGYRFTLMEMKKHRVGKVLIEKNNEKILDSIVEQSPD